VIADATRFSPRIILPGWSLVDRSQDGESWVRTSGQSLIWSVAREEDGRLWLHISTAYPDRLPKWGELVAAKEWIAGTDRYAYQVIPPRSRYVNQHPFVLHVFVPLEGDPPLPDFTHGGGSL
jgi:hypothetical protein